MELMCRLARRKVLGALAGFSTVLAAEGVGGGGSDGDAGGAAEAGVCREEKRREMLRA